MLLIMLEHILLTANFHKSLTSCDTLRTAHFYQYIVYFVSTVYSCLMKEIMYQIYCADMYLTA